MLPLIGACVPLSRWSRRPGYWLDDDCCRLWESLDQENMVVRWLCVVLGLELFVRAERSLSLERASKSCFHNTLCA